MALEQKYADQMRALGTWEEAFAPEVHTLCVMERELRRTQKAREQAIKAGRDKTSSELYAVILQLRRDILAHRDSLGLTPKGLQRLRGREGRVQKPVQAMDLTCLSDAELETLARQAYS